MCKRIRLLTPVDVCISLNIAITGHFSGPRYTLLSGEKYVRSLTNGLLCGIVNTRGDPLGNSSTNSK